MDTLTQITLGASVGEAVLGKQVGRQAALWGGICGLLPDLDVLLPLGDAVKNFTYHRSASHSIFVLTLFTPLMVFLILKLRPALARHKRRWVLLVWLALVTHVLLDCFTVYGTQIFWPLKTPPVMWSTIFIIDPAYTVPLLGGLLAALILTRHRNRGHLLNTAGLVLSTAYLAWSVGVKLHVTAATHAELQRQDIAYSRILTGPTPFNTVLWRILVMDDGGYYEGFYSLLDKRPQIHFDRYASRSELLAGIEDHWPVQRLQWFTHGFYAVDKRFDSVVMTDLRMGLEPDYVFSFKVGRIGNPHAKPSPSEKVKADRALDRLAWVWDRIWDPDAPRGAQVGFNRR